ncbi:MAG: hypothetical protein LBH44_09715 [Treponema sp.]|nr:hypothetical protein [Treponema sp.]
MSGVEDVDYYSLHPFAHCCFFMPFALSGRRDAKNGWYIGAGGGYMTAELDYPEGKVLFNLFAFDLTSGFIIGNTFDISYTMRTNFELVTNKFAVGYVYRFRK